jgi:hydrogenase maturation protease HycI
MDRPLIPLPARLALLGIGNELRGDDAAGLHVARGLLARRDLPPGWLVLETGPAPENFTGWLRRSTPEMVLLVDAAQMGGHPGEVRWLDWQDTTGMSASTHTLPLHLVAQYIERELHCPVWLVGIQPQQNEVGALLSPAVAQAVEGLVKLLIEQTIPY